ncbi:hypothetical protein [Bacillus weihaiensis]|uniref:hypothetical protein n=1 Tax=Bacillus weihaiensis TaxID=1547283 RepID=UPI002353CB6B|nr:hypothetical protein [Bacillus weihaiensis]
MRLTKQAYFLDKVFVGYDVFGLPTYDEARSDPFYMEFEPYGTQLASRDYGVNVAEINYRMFTHPNDRFELNMIIHHKEKEFKILQIMDYDKHYEILVRLEGSVEGD